MLKIRRPLGRLIFNMGIAIPGKTVFLIETAPWQSSDECLCYVHFTQKRSDKICGGETEVAIKVQWSIIIKKRNIHEISAWIQYMAWHMIKYYQYTILLNDKAHVYNILHTSTIYTLKSFWYVNSSPPGKNGRHFTDDTFKRILMNEKLLISNFTEVCSQSNW